MSVKEIVSQSEEKMTKTILFICQGNSIRSIMAEAIFNHLCKKDYKAISAGTLHISRIDPKAKEVLKKLAEENPDKLKEYRRNAYLKQKEKKKQKELKIKIMK